MAWRSPWCSARRPTRIRAWQPMNRATRTAAVAWLITAFVLLLSVHAALGAGRHDAAAVGCVRPQRDGRGVDGRPVLLRLLAVQPRRRRGHGRLGPRKVVPIGAAAVGVGALLFAIGQRPAGEHRPVSAGRRRRVRAGRRRLHRDDEFPGLARGHADRRHADVRHGRRIGRPVRGRTR